MDKLKIANFRSISDQVEIEMARINIITGPNNSGKSNVLKLLLLFDDYINSSNHFSLLFNGFNAGKHKIDSYQNAVNWSNWKADKSIGFSFKHSDSELIFEFMPYSERSDKRKPGWNKEGRLNRFEFISAGGHKLSLSFKKGDEYLLTVERALINELWIKNDFPDRGTNELVSEMETQQAASLKRLSGMIKRTGEIGSSAPDYPNRIKRLAAYIRSFEIYQAKIDKLGEEVKYRPESETIKTSISVTADSFVTMRLHDVISEGIRGYFSSEKAAESMILDAEVVKQELKSINWALKRYFAFRLAHLAPDRSDQSRIHLFSDKMTEVNRLIYYQKVRPFQKNSVADRFLIKWMRVLNIGTNYRLQNMEGIAWAIEVKGDYGWRNIVDKGFGAGQIFSLLMRIAEVIERASNTSSRESGKFPFIVAIEEPEANLHPKSQSLLADIFMDAIDNANVQFIIETHSEYLIRRFQYLVSDKRKKFSSENIKVLYFQEQDPKHPGTDLVYDLEMRPDGILKRDFGPGFFDEATRLTLNLLKNQKNI